jgi:hypothetical protein
MVTRLVAEHSNAGSAGNETFSRERYRRSGADPPKNESGIRVRDAIRPYNERLRDVNTGNGSCIMDSSDSSSELEGHPMEILYMRSLRSMAEVIFSVLHAGGQ